MNIILMAKSVKLAYSINIRRNSIPKRIGMSQNRWRLAAMMIPLHRVEIWSSFGPITKLISDLSHKIK